MICELPRLPSFAVVRGTHALGPVLMAKSPRQLWDAS